ncbi:amidohydrolase [Psychrobacter sp. Marseille-P5312]|uniref:amidohydrolase n=1 Tax=Psychrobacter sp. Marseille-P5312 TaxID=2086574 RepID=UPI001D0D05C6|nr:amidohydrolase [Psychrobacter sp. Marseille-P5312]
MSTHRFIRPVLLGMGLLSMIGCAANLTADNQDSTVAVQAATSQATIYYNGNIITMEGDQPQLAQALVTQNGKIAYVGSLKHAQDNYKNAATVDLQHQTLLPGFIDPHSHFGLVSNTMGQVDLSAPPIGKIDNIDKMLRALKAYKKDNNIADGEWIFGWGYDATQLTEDRHPTKEEIDSVLPNNPVYLQHTSGHMGVANSSALAAMDITADSQSPEGGNIARVKGSNKPNGLLQETAMYPLMYQLLKTLEPKQAQFFDQTQDYYAKYGVTTAQDGSPQGKTAYFTQPYLTPVPNCESDCRGLPSISQEKMNEMFVKAYKNDNQLFIHNNGDAATDMILKAHEYAVKQTGQAADKDRRIVPIHTQFARPDQLAAFKKHNMVPSFFTNHAYFWGDVHIKNLGEKRANSLSSLATVDKMGIPYTNHSDDTVTPVDPLFSVWTAVNRTSRTGQVIGADERITPYQALKAITSNAAYQYLEEDTKGTLAAGKLADLVILDNNPLTIKPADIRNIKVVKTIKEGNTIYQRPVQ